MFCVISHSGMAPILSNILKVPTRVTDSSTTLIDLFLTNKPKYFNSADVVVLGISDHNLIYAIKKHPSDKSKLTTTQSCRYNKI